MLETVKSNIEDLVKRKIDVKLNVVLLRGFNDDEIIDLVKYGARIGVDIRFIEYMPFFGNSWEYDKVYTRKEILHDISEVMQIELLKSPVNSRSPFHLWETISYALL